MEWKIAHAKLASESGTGCPKWNKAHPMKQNRKGMVPSYNFSKVLSKSTYRIKFYRSSSTVPKKRVHTIRSGTCNINLFTSFKKFTLLSKSQCANFTQFYLTEFVRYQFETLHRYSQSYLWEDRIPTLEQPWIGQSYDCLT